MTARRAILPALLTLALIGGSAAALLAHDTWLLPASLRVEVGAPLQLSLTSGVLFPVDDFTIAPARVVRASVRLAGSTTALSRMARATPKALRYTWTPAAAGVATVAVALEPRTLTLAPRLVAVYLDEINADAALRDEWARLRAPKQWRELYVKHAKTFVRVGEPQLDTSWAKPIGLTLELVPESDPTQLRVGDTLSVRALREGVPVADFAIGATPAGEHSARFSRTGTDGRARIVFPREGLWLLNGTLLRRATRRGLEWESDFTTLTLAVRTRAAVP